MFVTDRLVFAAMIILLSVGTSFAQDKRVALLIGNSGYEYAPKLPNPANDANDLAKTLERIGFDVSIERRYFSCEKAQEYYRRAIDAYATAGVDKTQADHAFATRQLTFACPE